MRPTSKCSSAVHLVAMACCVATGCQSARIAMQGTGFHDALVKMYDDQIWDSLIRAKQNKPFALLNYTELFGQDAEEADVSGGGGEFVPSFRGAKNGWFVHGGAQRSGLLNFKAAPVGNGIVISSVVRFARERLKESSSKPPSCYDFRERDGRYYYITTEDASAFMDLALRASFPIDEAAAEQGYYLLTIAAVTQEAPENGPPVVRFTFTSPVPNGGGLLSTPLGPFELRPVANRNAGEGTRELIAAWREVYRPRDPGVLKGITARFFSTEYPPTAKSPAEQNAELLKKVINSVDRLGA